MTNLAAAGPTTERSHGRGYLWAGIGLALLGIVLGVVQYSLKQLIVPWYAAVLASLGVLLLLVSLGKRRSLVRFLVLGLVVALAGFEWVFLLSLSKIPAYQGPAWAGEKLPAFQTTLADGSSFTEKDLERGTPSVLVFFRGHW